MTNEEIQIEAFMGHVPHSLVEYVVQTLESYEEVICYLVALETSTKVGEHMHFIVKTVKSGFYEKFRERVFKRKLALRGKALKNKPRQYGKIKDIKDYEKLGAYTVKDANIRTNFPQDEIDIFCQKSYKKFELEGYYSQFLDKIDKFVEKHITQEKADRLALQKTEAWINQPYFEKNKDERINLDYPVKIFIIKELKDSNTESITKGKIDAIWNRWMSSRMDPEDIYYYIYQKRA